jgi:prolyl 4-hydroxylase
MTAWPVQDEIIRCIEERAREFQGYGPLGPVAPLQVVRYGPSDKFDYHYDWSNISTGGNPETTFFVYLQANCTGGGTYFPRLQMPSDSKWCEFVECDHSKDFGVTFRPVAGNAIFWRNLRSDGQGHEDTLHAGLEIKSGSKIGLNIWTRQRLLEVEDNSSG